MTMAVETVLMTMAVETTLIDQDEHYNHST